MCLMKTLFFNAGKSGDHLINFSRNCFVQLFFICASHLHTQRSIWRGGRDYRGPQAHTFYAANHIKILYSVILVSWQRAKDIPGTVPFFLEEDKVRSIEKRAKGIFIKWNLAAKGVKGVGVSLFPLVKSFLLHHWSYRPDALLLVHRKNRIRHS